jgi:hypothetical protein
MIGNIELHGVRIGADAFCSRLALLEITRSNQHREAVRHEVLRDLKADTLIGAGDECDRFIWHGCAPFAIDAFAPSGAADLLESPPLR